jgi:putative ABC transport system permease protein
VLTRALAEKVDSLAGGSAVPLIGAHIHTLDAAHNASFVVVGEVIDVNEADANNWNPQQAWVPSAVVPRMVATRDLGYEMAYRFDRATTSGAIDAQLSSITAALPSGALDRSYPYTEVRTVVTITTSLVLTFLIAFGIFALGAAALIVTNVVAGAVLANYREIGIMKAIGFTPRQVVGVLTGQMLVPALAGCLIGIPIGALLSRPLLESSAHAMGLPAPSTVAPAMDLLALAGVLAVVALSAMLPAWRGGRLSAIHAIATGTAPQTPRSSWLGRRLQKLGLPRSLSLGAGDAFVRPLRGGLTALAIVIGVATFTFAYGLHGTMQTLNNEPALHGNDYVGGNYQVEVDPIDGIGDHAVLRAIQSQPETRSVVSFADAFVSVPSLTDPVQAIFTRGDATRLGYQAMSGRWVAGPNEAVAADAFLKEAHLRVGDRFTISYNGRRIPVRLVGTEFDLTSRGRVMRLDWSSLQQLQPGATPYHYAVQLAPGSDPVAYGRRVQGIDPSHLTITVNDAGSAGPALLSGVVAALALILLLIAVVGVFNTMLLTTRERIHDTAVLRTMGMSPRQVTAMVIASAGVLGIVGGILGIPAGVGLHRAVLGLIADLVGNTIPIDAGSIFPLAILPMLGLAGLATAILGALLPARWAARTMVVEILRQE